jgi:cyclopropane fatty-acyl-phospholipid synthase-like methyltransferase
VPEDANRRDLLRSTFDAVAPAYQGARPEYPDRLFDDLAEWAELSPSSSLLEIGPASGKATLPLARRGYTLTCLELGVELAARAAANLAAYPRVRVVRAAFETWVPPPGERFDLVFAANAWHWIDPDRRYGKAHELLRPQGRLALWAATHVFPEGGDPIFAELQPTYDEVDPHPGQEPSCYRPGQLPDARREIEATGLFTDVRVRQYDWETVHDAESYIALINTFSSHIAMSTPERERLFSEIRRRLSLRPDGLLRRHWGSVLQVATRKP